MIIGEHNLIIGCSDTIISKFSKSIYFSYKHFINNLYYVIREFKKQIFEFDIRICSPPENNMNTLKNKTMEK